MAKAMLLFLVTSVALGLTSLHLVRELRAERATSESLQARVSALEQAKASQPAPAAATPFATWSVQEVAPPPAAARTPPDVPDRQALVGTLSRASGAIPAPSVPTQEEQMRRMQEHVERQRALLSDPDYREAMRMQQRMAFVRQHPELVEELGLTSEQADQFFSLMAEQNLREMDSSQAAMMTYDPTDAPAREKMARKALERQRAREAEIAQLLGPQKLETWKEYQSTLGARYQAKELRDLLASNGVPLQPELTKPLLNVLAQDQQRTMQDMRREADAAARAAASQTNKAVAMHPFDERQLDRMAEQNRRTREALSSILTAEQLDLYAKQQDASLQMQRAQWRAMRAQAQATGTDVMQQGSMTLAPFVGSETFMYASPAAPVSAQNED